MPYATSTRNSLVAHVISIVFGLIALIILLHLAFVLLEANTGNPLVSAIADLANWFSWLFRDMFTIDDPKARAVANYGLAALVYLLVGGAIVGAGRRRWGRRD
jgi:hypothetical protein